MFGVPEEEEGGEEGGRERGREGGREGEIGKKGEGIATNVATQ